MERKEIHTLPEKSHVSPRAWTLEALGFGRKQDSCGGARGGKMEGILKTLFMGTVPQLISEILPSTTLSLQTE